MEIKRAISLLSMSLANEAQPDSQTGFPLLPPECGPRNSLLVGKSRLMPGWLPGELLAHDCQAPTRETEAHGPPR